MPTNKHIMDASRRLYEALPGGKFDRASVIELGKCVGDRVAWEDVPAEVKVPLIRVAVALGLVQAEERRAAEAATVPEAPAVPDQVTAPASRDVTPGRGYPDGRGHVPRDPTREGSGTVGSLMATTADASEHDPRLVGKE